jgi:hypothetical protein
MSYVTDQELLKLVTAARLPADVAVRLAELLRQAGTPGPAGPAGATGPAGPAPSGTGYVRVTGGVLDAAVDPIPGADVTQFDAVDPGVVPASGGGTSTFLRADGTWVTPSGVASAENLIFGDGSDGDGNMNGGVVAGITPSGTTYNATRDLFFNSLTIDGAYALRSAGFRVFVKGTLTLNGQIRNNGFNGGNGGNAAATIGNTPGGTAGSRAPINGVLPGGTVGGVGGSGTAVGAAGGNTSASSWPFRGNGGALGAGAVGNGANGTAGVGTGTGGGPGGGGGGGGGAVTPGGSGSAGGNIGAVGADSGTLLAFPQYITGRPCAGGGVFELGTGGGGGGGGFNAGGTTQANGGGGGGSAGMVMVAAYEIVGTGSIAANGGNGGNGGTGVGSSQANAGGGGGGGGGSGGMVVCIIGNGSFPTMTATGGTGGTGGVGKGTGGTGGNGGNGDDGVVLQLRSR